MQQRDGSNETGCINMDCPGFVRADGAVIAPGDVIHPSSAVLGAHIQSITVRVLKVRVAFLLTYRFLRHWFTR
jgi:hypothetical protein